MGIFKRAIAAVKKRFKEDTQGQQPNEVHIGEEHLKGVAEALSNRADVSPEEAANIIKKAVNGRPNFKSVIDVIEELQDNEPWYEKERPIKISFGQGGFKLKVTKAGEVHILQQWIKRRENALKYARHTKSRARIEKRIKQGNKALAICIEQRIGIAEAFKQVKGVK